MPNTAPDYTKAMSPDAERRFIPGNVEIKTRMDGDTPLHSISGYAAKYNSPTVIGSRSWGFREQYAPGCFDDVMATADVRCLFNHDPNNVLGRSNMGEGTMRLESDETGLKFTCEIAGDISLAQDVARMIERGDVSQCSCAFTIGEQTWTAADENDPESMDERTIVRVAGLYDVGPVTYPAYSDTEVAARSKAVTLGEESPTPGNEPETPNMETACRNRQMAELQHTIHKHT